MSRPWVVNASPVILLGKIAQLSLFEELCDQLLIPQAVVEEILAGPADDPAARWIDTLGRNFIVPDAVVPVSVSAWNLGARETQVISRCLQSIGYEAILDDGTARKCARTFGIPCTGTLGVLMRAKQAQKIGALSPLVEQLLQHGFRIDGKTLQFVMEWAHEPVH